MLGGHVARFLVVGAGQVGAAVCREVVARGDEAWVVTRSGTGPELPGVRRVAADASDAEALRSLAAGADVVINAANPPYHRWPDLWPPLASAMLDTAHAAGAVLATVSNVYGYGPVDVPMTEDLPLAATTVKGRVRAGMWRDALAAHEADLVRAFEVRGSDYLCPGPQSQFGDRVMKPLMAGHPARLLGSLDEPHTWTSPADVARTLVHLAQDERAWGRAWHVPSAPPRTQREVVADLSRAAGVTPRPAILPSAALLLAGIFSPVVRELREMAYEFDRPFILDSTSTETTFSLAPTPWSEQIAAQVAAYRS
jgi:nucleoside-diphosphate-sugar epimerase